MRYSYGSCSIAIFTEQLISIRQYITFANSFQDLLAIMKASTHGTEIATGRSVKAGPNDPQNWGKGPFASFSQGG
jgi:hypothetical protein